MPAVAEEIEELLAPRDDVDPADADALGDDTVAGRRKRRRADAAAAEPVEEPGPPEKRLRLRPGVPVLSKYKGKKVSRKEAFGEGDVSDVTGVADGASDRGDGEQEDDGKEKDDSEEEAAGLTSTAAGGFSISEDLEAEYDRMMQQASKDLEVMRKPTASEVQKRQDDAKALKRQLEAWNSLVEFRIHLEGVLSLGHRLPRAGAAAAFREAEPAAATEGDAVAQELQGLLGELQALQGRLLEPKPLRAELLEAPPQAKSSSGKAEGEGEPAAWAALELRQKEVLGWALETADDWKQRTQLDTRRSFKVLDQSLRLQMQAVAEADKEKQRKRCTPPPDKHKVFGAAAGSNAAAEAQGDAEPAAGDEGHIFDDREFYVQLLREVLSGGGGSGKTGLGEDAKNLQVELQGRRANKKKARAEVERRASKGRKIRFVPIEKLQNFMVPRPRFASSGAADGGGFAKGGPLLGGLSEESGAPSALREGAVEALLRSIFAPPAGPR